MIDKAGARKIIKNVKFIIGFVLAVKLATIEALV